MRGDNIFHNLRSLGGKLAFFRGGWGHVAAQCKRHQAWLDAVKHLAVPRPVSLDLSIRPHPVVGKEATFTSPCQNFLPPESSKGRVWIVEPTVKADDAPPPVVVHLAATGDHGFWLRYLLFARHLARTGVASALLENPLYGARIPSCQRGAKLHTVADLTDMGRATVEECRALLTYFHDRGHKRLAAFGLSQGGLHAAMAASLCYDFPVNVVSAIAPASAAPVFTRGVLSTAVDWSSLSARLEDKGGDVRAALASHLDAVASIKLFPQSPSGGRHILLAASDDQYVEGDAVDVWRAARPGIEVRLLHGVGHFTAVALRSNEVRRAIIDSLAPSH